MRIDPFKWVVAISIFGLLFLVGQAQTSFQWTEEPTVNSIPSTPVQGIANGGNFRATEIYFEHHPGGEPSEWNLIIRDKPRQGNSLDYQTISVNLPEAPSQGKVLEKPMSYGGGHFHIRRDPKVAENRTSWNGDNAWVLEITRWTYKGRDETSTHQRQQVGTASGKIAVCYKGNDQHGLSNSWAAGSFSNVPIYSNPPRR